MKIEHWIIIGLLFFIFGPFYNGITVKLYCTNGSLLGCDWKKGELIDDLVYLTIPRN
jgi:hypothetical protein